MRRPLELIAVIVAVAIALAACGERPRPRSPAAAEPLTADAYRHYLRGRIAVFEGDYARAARELAAAARAAPTEAPIEIALVEALYRAGQRDRAGARARAARKRWPRDARVWLASGRIHRGLRQHRAAARAYQRAVELAPDDEAAYLGLAAAHIALADPRRAEDVYRRLVAALPASVEGRLRLGQRLLDRNPSAAAAQLARAVELDPGHLGARLALARAYRRLGRGARAVATLREAFDRSQGSPRVGRALFAQLLEAGDHQGAARLLEVLDRDDLELSTRVTFGHLYLQIGEADRTIALARALRRRAPRDLEVVLLEARALEALGRGIEAAPALLAVSPRRRGYAEAHALAIEIVARSGDADRALALAAGARAHAPADHDLLAAHALALELSGAVDDARALLGDALTADADTDDLRYALASLEERQGRSDAAVALIEPVLARDPDDATALNFIGYSLADRGIDLGCARALLRRALELQPDSGYLLDSWGWLLFREGRVAAAERVLRRAVRLVPAEPEILWHLGEVYLARGRHRDARAILERARRFAVDLAIRRRIEARLATLRGPA